MNPDPVLSHRIPNVVSKRNHFACFDGVVDDLISRIACRDEGNIVSKDQLRAVLRQLASVVARECESAFSTAAERGIAQARTLMEDPAYYETLKERRKREVVRQSEYEEQQRVERAERDQNPEYRERHIAEIHRAIDFNRKDLTRLDAHLTEYLEFCKTPPKLERIPISDKASRLPGEKAEVLSFPPEKP